MKTTNLDPTSRNDSEKGAQMSDVEKNLQDLQLIKGALWKYHHALDERHYGNLAAAEFVSDVEIILNTPWIKGKTLATLDLINT